MTRDDREQLEYIRKWVQMKKEKEEKKLRKKELAKMYFLSFKNHLRAAIRNFWIFISICFDSIDRY